MSIGTPQAVPDGLLQRMLEQMQERSLRPDGLISKWRQHGIVTEENTPEFAQDAPWKVQFQKLKAIWGQWCVVMITPRNSVCTCPVFCDEGHCPHVYVGEDL